MEQHNQRRVMMTIQPVDVDEIPVIEFPAFPAVGDKRAGKQVWINSLGIASPQPSWGNIRSGAQRKRSHFHATCLRAMPGSEPATSGLKGVSINWAIDWITNWKILRLRF